jgi:hypothetical protein
MMDAAAEYGGSGQRWRQWTRTAIADNDSGGQQRRRMTTARKIKRRTTRRDKEGGRQMTTALGQPSREHETKIKKIEFTQKDFFQGYGLSGWSF